MTAHPDSDDPAGWEARALAVLMDQETGADEAAVDGAIALLRRSVEGTPAGDQRRPGVVNNLGLALLTRFSWSDNPDDLNDSVRLFREAVDVTPRDAEDRTIYTSNLGLALRTRFEATGATGDLDEAVGVAREAAAAPPPDHPESLAPLSNLGLLLRVRFDHRGDIADLDEAVSILRSVAETAPDEVKHQWVLATVLRERFDHRLDQADLDEAVAALRTALTLVAEEAPECPPLRSDLGIALLTLFDRVGHDWQLDEAEAHARAALHDDRSDPAYLTNLSVVLLARFTRFGDTAQIDEAADLARAAVMATPEGELDRGAYQSNVGLILRTRYDHVGDDVDLEEAVGAGRAAVALTPSGHRDAARDLCNLGLTLLSRFERFHERADIDEAVAISRAAVDATPPEHPDLARFAANLCGALQTRFEQFGDPADLNEAVHRGRIAVDATPDDHPDLPLHLSNLASALLSTIGRADHPIGLDEAVSIAERAVSATAPDDPNVAACQSNLGVARRARFRTTAQPEDRVASATAFGAAALVEHAPPLIRALAARAAAELHATAGDWVKAFTAYGSAIDVLPLVVDRQLPVESRHHRLGRLDELGRDSAAAALNTEPGRAGAIRAMSALERTRGLIIGQSLDTRVEIGALRGERPDLAEEFDRLRALLNLDRAGSGRGSTSRALAIHRRRAAAEWRQLVATIRTVPGFDTFLLPPTAAELAAVAAAGPIVALNISRHRCDALVVRPDGVDMLPLPNMSHDQVEHHAHQYLAAVHDPDLRDNTGLRDVLSWLWDGIMEPVLVQLGYTGRPAAGTQWPRVWWLPTGPMAMLPLHAAGRYPARNDGDSVLDRVVSSYTPTIRTLRHAVTQPSLDARHALLLAVPEAVGSVDLRHAADEIRLVAGRLAATTTDLHTFVGPEATRSNALATLATATWIHCACHAMTDPTEPTASYLDLSDGRLTVRDLASLESRHGELAYLSSCDSTFGGSALPDETLHIGAALHLAGFAHVIGTLWPVLDRRASVFADQMYERLVSGIHPAHALHDTMIRARAARPDHPYFWAPYQHIGP